MLVTEQFLRSMTESRLGREGRGVRMGWPTGRGGFSTGLACFLREQTDSSKGLREWEGWEVIRGIVLGDEHVQGGVQNVAG